MRWSRVRSALSLEIRGLSTRADELQRFRIGGDLPRTLRAVADRLVVIRAALEGQQKGPHHEN